MSAAISANHDGMTLRQAALVAGFTYLLNPVTYAEYVYPKLVISGDAEQTVQNISSHEGAFLAAIFCYFISFIGDVVIAWSLYVLLARVNRSLSLLAALFQLVYAARNRRDAQPGDGLSHGHHTGISHVIWTRSVICPG
jgi:Domain of unknown function (DUF4386)